MLTKKTTYYVTHIMIPKSPTVSASS